MLAVELAEQQRDEVRSGARGGADRERSAQLAGLLLLELVDELPLQLQHPPGASVEEPPRLGRLDAAPRAVEKPASEPLFERSDLQAHGRLGNAEGLRGLREAPLVDDRAERRKLPRVHKETLYGDPRKRACSAERGFARVQLLSPSARSLQVDAPIGKGVYRGK